MGSKCCAISASFLLSVLLVLPENVQSLSLSSKKTAPKVPAVLLFGDSIVDTGNNNELLTTTRCDFPPYGKDFPGHMATGRFSNGRNPSDILASQLGIKEFVPPYLGTELDAEELLTGVCFASGGCGYDPQTSKITSALSLGDQLDMFREYKEKLKRIAGEGRAEQIIANSLYVVVSGSNDIVTTYFLFPFRRKKGSISLPTSNFLCNQVQVFCSFHIAIGNSSQELYQSGARKIAVMGVPPLGCVPSQRTLAGGKGRDCVAQYNDVSRLFNSELSKEVQRLNNILPLSTIPYIDMYTPVLDMILHPSAYGFKEVTRGCCGTGYIEVTLSCNSYTSLACGNASEYVFWDSFHPTERTAEIFITKFLQQYGHLLVD